MPMLRGRLLIVAAILVAIGTAALYATRLSHAPIYLIHDEVNFSLQAISVASTGRDLNGRLLPVYFSEPEFPAGRDPMMIYATALGLTVMPLSDAAVRIPTALVGVLIVVLVLVLHARLTTSPWMPLAAALLLALSPGLFIHSRLALSVIYPLPFVLLWLIALHEYDRRPRPWLLGAGTASLGLGIYGYLAGVIMMPLYLAATVWCVRAWRNPRLLAWIAAGFGVVLLPIVFWHVAHPERYAELLQAYRMDGRAASGIAPALSVEGVRLRLGAWWQYFNPEFLFLAGDTSMTNSTRTAGFFPIAFAVLLPLGIARLWHGSRFERLLVLGFITGPLAAVATGTLDLNRYRAMFVLPFGALVAVHGLEQLWASRAAWRQAAAVVLIASVPLQFAGFYRDYMGRYRDASSVWFGGNIKGALAEVFQRREQGDALLVSERVPYGDAYTRFYSQVWNETRPPEAPILVDGSTFDLNGVEAGSWLIAAANEGWLSRLTPGGWERVAAITEPSGTTSFLVYRRRTPSASSAQ
ncbi:MAG TPA: glycosyltransferase family 39 protein [Vicinamibacterales bacterium]|nr:glycosyltransferase family 39 protein [Vicinamibacterales bacterium]